VCVVYVHYSHFYLNRFFPQKYQHHMAMEHSLAKQKDLVFQPALSPMFLSVNATLTTKNLFLTVLHETGARSFTYHCVALVSIVLYVCNACKTWDSVFH